MARSISTDRQTTAAKRTAAVERLTIDLSGVAHALGVSKCSALKLWKAKALPNSLRLDGLEKRLWSVEAVREWIRAGCPPQDGGNN